MKPSSSSSNVLAMMMMMMMIVDRSFFLKVFFLQLKRPNDEEGEGDGEDEDEFIHQNLFFQSPTRDSHPYQCAGKQWSPIVRAVGTIV